MILASKLQSRCSTARVDYVPISHSAEGVTYQCSGPGALLSIPHEGSREDFISPNAFEEYIRDNVVCWFEWSKKIGLGVEHMEDLILVTGRTLVTSWSTSAFLGRSRTAEISLVHTPEESRRCFACSNIRGGVARGCSRVVPVSSPCYA